MKAIKTFFLSCCIATSLEAASYTPQALAHFFSVQYAPYAWKQSYCGWNLENEVKTLEKTWSSDPKASLFRFIKNTRDYHVGARFYSTEASILPFRLVHVGGRFFVSEIFENFEDRISLAVGDEVISWNGKPIMSVVRALINYAGTGEEDSLTEQQLAAYTLTERWGSRGLKKESGSVRIESIRNNKKVISHIKWIEIPEVFPYFGEKKASLGWDLDFTTNVKNIFQTALSKKVSYPAFLGESSSVTIMDSRFSLGNKEGYLPALGKVVWRWGPQKFKYFPFLKKRKYRLNAYISELETGKKVGYVRIPTFSPSPELEEDEELLYFDFLTSMAEEYKAVFKYLRENSDMILVDQTRNPGGVVFYCYAVLSCISQKELHLSQEKIKISNEDVVLAQIFLKVVEIFKDYSEKEANDFWSEIFMGIQPAKGWNQAIASFAEGIIDAWEKGQDLTDPLYFFGVDYLKPVLPDVVEKPVVCLVDELCFSCGDIFPAILQDNGVAIIAGSKTAGAGGSRGSFSFPNIENIEEIYLTTSLVLREDGGVIENVGITPDVEIAMEVEDINTNFTPFVYRLTTLINEILLKDGTGTSTP